MRRIEFGIWVVEESDDHDFKWLNSFDVNEYKCAKCGAYVQEYFGSSDDECMRSYKGLMYVPFSDATTCEERRLKNMIK